MSTAFTAPIIRTARAEDAPAIAELSAQLGYPVPAASIAQRLNKLLARPDHAVFVCADDDGNVLGWASAEQRLTLATGDYIELAGLVVEEGMRRRGIGAALVTAVEAWCRRRGVEDIFVRSNTVREQAHAFYQRMGYEHGKTQHAYRHRLGG
ncbi:MAG: GNAT family N-acetyltransferase [Pseudoxanthomonas suwonensis]|nr:GNAT family N-acetyltransferase [Pseudoxanthomonas suwonensis]